MSPGTSKLSLIDREESVRRTEPSFSPFLDTTASATTTAQWESGPIETTRLLCWRPRADHMAVL